MNQDQRKFLIAQVERTFEKQADKLKEPVRPSLNNYLVAAVLDDSIRYVDIEELKAQIKKKVLDFGPKDALVSEDEEYNYRRQRRTRHDFTVTLKAESIFVLPPGYVVALEKYNREMAEYEAAVANLEACKDTIIMKIQIGSNAVLDKLVTDVDNMADLRIMNAKFLLNDNFVEPKKIAR